MPRIKTLLTQSVVERAIRAHNCQANASHRIHKGEPRLSIRNGRNMDKYCVECARKIIAKDLKKLTELSQSLESCVCACEDA
jgi:hypothetical protein